MGAFLLLFFLSLPLRYTLLDTSWELLRPLSWNLGCNIQIFSAKKKNNAERLKKKASSFSIERRLINLICIDQCGCARQSTVRDDSARKIFPAQRSLIWIPIKEKMISPLFVIGFKKKNRNRLDTGWVIRSGRQFVNERVCVRVCVSLAMTRRGNKSLIKRGGQEGELNNHIN